LKLLKFKIAHGKGPLYGKPCAKYEQNYWTFGVKLRDVLLKDN